MNCKQCEQTMVAITEPKMEVGSDIPFDVPAMRCVACGNIEPVGYDESISFTDWASKWLRQEHR